MVFEHTRSKIVCTIGPASHSKTTLTKMIDAGMDVVRLNMSHEDHSTAKKTFETIRTLNDRIPILFDLQGPKIRVGELKEPVVLMTGQEFVISIDDFVGDETRVSISYKDLPQDVRPGDMIALNDGIIRLVVKKIKGTEVTTEVTYGGPLSSRKGANIPGIKLSCKIPTEDDIKDLDLAAELEPDMVALSFVTGKEDIVKLRELLTANGPKDAWIIPKIEHILACHHFDEILNESDGVMIARGDLGIEVPIEEVPVLQKELIRRANISAKPAIVATHMLESMTKEMMPTRAEVSDVAHAILERADAVMLSGETAVGHDPVGAVKMMNRIITRAEQTLPKEDPILITSPKKIIVEIIGNLACNAVNLIPEKIDGIISATRTGYTARWISKFRPPTNIYAVSADIRVARKLGLVWGVYPIMLDIEHDNVEGMITNSTKHIYEQGFIQRDKDIVFTSGLRRIPGRTNIVGVFHIRDLIG